MRWLMTPLCLAAFGCKDPKAMGDLRKLLPEVGFSDLKVDHIDFEGLDAKLVLDVTNPYPVGLDLTSADWKLGLAGSPFLDGTNPAGLSIAASETGKLRIPFSLAFEDAFRVAAAAKGADELPFDLDVDLGFATPVGPVTIPFQHQGELPALHAPNVSLKALRVEKLDLLKQTATIALDLGLTSASSTTLSFDAFDYDLQLGGRDVADGTARLGDVTGSGTATLPIDLQLVSLGASVIDMLQGKSAIAVHLTADATVGTPFGPVPLRVDRTADLTPR